MFFPYRDDNPTTGKPIVTIAIIAANILVYLLVSLHGDMSFRQSIVDFGLIPTELVHFRNLYLSPAIPPVATIFTSLFMHAGLMHLAGNMWFLWIFGDNVEDRLGHWKFLLFYLAAGIAASLAHVIFFPHSQIPVVGASGAISGILGAYAVMFPHARIRTFIFIIIFFDIIMVPAIVFIGFWILFQVVSGLMSLGADGAGVAWFAHIGGFVFGIYALRLFGWKNPLFRQSY